MSQSLQRFDVLCCTVVTDPMPSVTKDITRCWLVAPEDIPPRPSPSRSGRVDPQVGLLAFDLHFLIVVACWRKARHGVGLHGRCVALLRAV